MSPPSKSSVRVMQGASLFDFAALNDFHFSGGVFMSIAGINTNQQRSRLGERILRRPSAAWGPSITKDRGACHFAAQSGSKAPESERIQAHFSKVNTLQYAFGPAHSGAVETEKSFNNQLGELMTTVTLQTMLCNLLDSHHNSRPGSHVNHCDYNPAIAKSGLTESNTEPRLVKKVKQFYMLGPNVLGVSPDLGRRVKFKTFLEPYRTVVSDLHYVEGRGNEFKRLIELCKKLEGSTLIFCRSPNRATMVVKHLLNAGLGAESPSCREAADWVADHYHPEWHFAKALRLGIGVHHGRIPRALAQFVVRAFDAGDIKFLVCTSTLIEGVNTKAKNIIIFDHEISRTPIDLFTFNNIRGRAGRMREHFVGHVYLFHPEPEQELPMVDMPVFTQPDDTPESLLIQIDEEDLKPESRQRLSRFLSQEVLDYETLKANVGLDPQRQINLAREIRENLPVFTSVLQWSGLPSAWQVQQICDLLWRHFDGAKLGAGSVRSPAQLTFLINGLRSVPTVRRMVIGQVEYWEDADTAVQQVLDFLRLWANFHFPRLLRGLNRIQQDLLKRANLPYGEYEHFANRVENYFLDAAIVALDEYGIPLEMARKLLHSLDSNGDLDATLEKLRLLDVETPDLTSFEKRIIAEAQSCL